MIKTSKLIPAYPLPLSQPALFHPYCFSVGDRVFGELFPMHCGHIQELQPPGAYEGKLTLSTKEQL
jgi:hypothetical protein